MSCCSAKYETPVAYSRSAPQEKLLYVTCARHASDKPDYLATVDLEKGEVIHRLKLLHAGDEIHHSGWDVCASCPSIQRSKIILPCLNSSRIYIVDVSDQRQPRIHKTVEPEELFALDVSFPHTTHCLPSGEILVSTLGDAKGNGKGSFIVIDAKTFRLLGHWQRDGKSVGFNYDYWYQPYHDVLISTEWGSPNKIKKGFDPKHVAEGHYGHSLHVWSWSTRSFVKTLPLDPSDGVMPLEIRFKHDPTACHGFVGCALSSNVWHFWKDVMGEWKAHKVIQIPSIDVEGWALPSMPGLITDILLSLDDRYLYFSNWLHGDVRQYDVSDPFNPVLVSQVYISGSLCSDGSVKTKKAIDQKPPKLIVKGSEIEGGPQMLQLSADGRRLYVTTSLYSAWDNQFYPDLTKKGAAILKIDITDRGMTLDRDFVVDFGKEPDGPILAHEMRYPGGDCTSDIWLAPSASGSKL